MSTRETKTWTGGARVTLLPSLISESDSEERTDADRDEEGVKGTETMRETMSPFLASGWRLGALTQEGEEGYRRELLAG